MNQKFVPYQVAKRHLQEGDVLLFRGHGLVSWIIKQAGRGDYSHCGLLTKCEDCFYVLEFREFIGSRMIPIETLLKEQSGEIDVYRPISPVPIIEFDLFTCIKIRQNTYEEKATSDCFKSFIGLPYGWKRILIFIYRRFLLVRLFYKMKTDDGLNNGMINPVCSTAVCHAIAKTYVDPVPNLADSLVEPSDLGRSALFSYLFTLE